MKNYKLAVFDCDGVLADFEREFCEAFGNQNRNLYSLSARYPDLDPDLIKEWVNDPENYRNLNPIFGGITLLNQLKSRGFDILLVTARPENLREVTTEWLQTYNINYTRLDMGVTEKGSYLVDTYGLLDSSIRLFVDDDIKHIREVKSEFPEAVCLLWSQPWNDGYFPRAIYDQEKMKVMVNMGDDVWKFIWSKT